MRLADGKERSIKYTAAATCWCDGKQIAAQQLMHRMFGDLEGLIAGEDELRESGAIRIDAADSDIFDVLAYVRFDLDPKSRRDRADTARAEGLHGREEEMREVLSDVLVAYEREGFAELDYCKLSGFLKIRYG